MIKELLVIIPAYNEEKNIPVVVEELEKYSEIFDYIIINDGSLDDTVKVCKDVGTTYLNIPVNVGLWAGVSTGIRYAYKMGYEYVIQFDGDGQHMPEYIEPMLSKAKEGYDVVIGSRFINNKKTFNMRMAGSFIIENIIKLVSNTRIKDPTSGMRLFNRKIMKEFIDNINYTPEPDTISYLANKGAKIVEIPVEMRDRVYGQSYLSLGRAMNYMFQILFSIIFIQYFRKRR